ncbi:MAG: hypothetical protein HY286_08640 [Planctomycetes bacterium]|nr:hypothetical protein [Planctomycetota bacterium]
MNIPAWLPPRSARSRIAAASSGTRIVALARRGFHYGFAVLRDGPAGGRSIAELWRASEPIVLKRRGAALAKKYIINIKKTLALFDELRGGADFHNAMIARLRGSRAFRATTAVADAGDAREIVKVYGSRRGGSASDDVYAKLSWISEDERDVSLRIRFSFGSERLRDWMGNENKSIVSDAFAEAAFPECGVITKNRGIYKIVETILQKRVRASERIIYNNAPGGGAVFHHDAEPRQLGVVYAQLAGETAWLALPKRELAARISARIGKTRARVLKHLDRGDDAAIEKLLNRSPDFARELVESGRLYLLEAGDVLLLPSNGADDVAWHSVFATGDRPSLALSFGIFRKTNRR